MIVGQARMEKPQDAWKHRGETVKAGERDGTVEALHMRQLRPCQGSALANKPLRKWKGLTNGQTRKQ